MIWKKLKKLVIPLIIAKLIILAFIIFSGDTISISRDINYNTNYEGKFDNDSIVQKRQKFIRIVRNEEERRFSIILRARKNARPHVNKEGEIPFPIVD